MQTITVHLKERSYPIHIEENILDQSGTLIRNTLGECRAAIVTDDHVAPLYLARLQQSMDAAGIPYASIVLPHGERTKCLAKLEELYTFLCACHITRRDAVVALGGGVIGDLSGLAAATYLRGVRFVQIPTTLLAQVDSSVGGKVAVDLPQGKNLVGAFHQPSLVLCDPLTLNTLTPDYWRDGLGEVVKYGCIHDLPLFEMLEQWSANTIDSRSVLMSHMDVILSHCIQAKADVVEQDEHDTGLRMTLNFGHTIAHAVETCQAYNGLRHGEAVAVGMSIMTKLTEKKGITQVGDSARLNALLDALSLPRTLPDIPENDLLSAMGMDKKNEGKTLRVIVLQKIGDCVILPTTVAFFSGMTDLSAESNT